MTEQGPQLTALLGVIDRPQAAALEAALAGRSLSVDEAMPLVDAEGVALHALAMTADVLRQRQVGDVVTYVVNRNINFTNICIKHCGFCAFSRLHRSEEGYFLDTEEIVRRATEAHALGATEVCIQAGLPPGLDGDHYIDLCRALKAALPSIHIHAFSPEEVIYGALRSRRPIAEYLVRLREAGLDSLPGTSAEILDDAIREVIAKGRISTQQWVEVITTAHKLGIRTTSTMMYGHIESGADQLRHMAVLRSIQEETGGFTEFVPLSFVYAETPMHLRQSAPGLRRGPSANEIIRTHALARVFLGASFRNIQASWVKDGLKLGQWLLSCGVNDLGGTLINESISTSAGAGHGQFVGPAALRRAIRGAGRIPAERSTLYELRKVFERPEDEVEGPLDRIDDADGAFGTYRALTRSSEHRFIMPRRRRGADSERAEEV
ncbi:MAG: 5-amino-6-(D-ribitylamino)uracil--L-tyrosine 4-hydroxyphenyl transferase CofH [Myxococcales bacterium]|nr:5-amino-6-(D-ribitylamino)uracil--L-tyrosine 4-hydroxyphenyl transferase CofH [Myxococcales bacterium]